LIGETFDLKLDGEKVTSVELILDSESMELYFRIPDFNDEYLTLSLPDLYADLYADLYDDGGEMAQMMSVYGSLLFGDGMSEIFDGFDLDAEEVEDLLVKYLTIALQSIETVTMDDYNLTVGGVTQSVTRLTVKVTQGDLLRMLRAVLTEMKQDETMNDLFRSGMESIQDLASAFGEELSFGMGSFALDLSTLIDMLLVQIPDPEANFEGKNDVLFTLYDYVDDDDAIVGRRFVVDGEDFFFGSVKNGNDEAFSVSFSGKDFLLGKGTVQDGLFTGKISAFGEAGEELFSVAVENFLSDETGTKGTLTFSLPSEVEGDGMNSAALGMLSQLSFVVQIDEYTEEKASVKLSLNAGTLSLVSVTSSGELTDPKPVTEPSDAYDLTDEEDLYAWIMKTDLEEVLELVEDLGLSEFLEDFVA
jgi:hypothetical protein